MLHRYAIYRDDTETLNGVIASNSPKRVFEIMSDERYDAYTEDDDICEAMQDLIKHGFPDLPQGDPAAWILAFRAIVDKHCTLLGAFDCSVEEDLPELTELMALDGGSPWNLPTEREADGPVVAHTTPAETTKLLALVKASPIDTHPEQTRDAYIDFERHLEAAVAAGAGVIAFAEVAKD